MRRTNSLPKSLGRGEHMRQPQGVLGRIMLRDLVEVEAECARDPGSLEVLLVRVARVVGHVPGHVEDGKVLLSARANERAARVSRASEPG